MSRNALSPPSPDAWQAQYLRLIAFPRQPQHAVRQTWWREVVGQDPETVTAKSGEREEHGPFGRDVLSLAINPLKIAWTVAPEVTPIELMGGPPSVGIFVAAAQTFQSAMQRWLPLAPPLQRLAFAGAFLQTVANKEEGYRLLDRYLRPVEVSEDWRDLQLLVNRRVDSAVLPGTLVNRLSKWAVIEYSISMSAGASEQENSCHACMLDLDINTVPSTPPQDIPAEQLSALFAELVSFGQDVASEGIR